MQFALTGFYSSGAEIFGFGLRLRQHLGGGRDNRQVKGNARASLRKQARVGGDVYTFCRYLYVLYNIIYN